MRLPTAFVNAMKQRLGEEFEAFMKSYEEIVRAGIRINTIKTQIDKVIAHLPYPAASIPWTKDGFYTPPEARPGKHPFYYAGLYYIQEPSAMSPVELLDVQPGDYVLDLCAAPGGKSVQIGAGLEGQGLLVTNDIHPDRTKALVRNMELYGVTQSVVLNEEPARIANAFPAFFDKVLVDAPCSGEGMFRKDPDMVRAWEREPVTTYAQMQQDILDSAAKLVAPGGRLVYSTCTFSPEENEASIARFLTKHPDYKVIPIELKHGFASGRPEWAQACMEEHGWEADNEAIEATRHTIRLWPHRLQGEGHYVAVLGRAGAREEREELQGAAACSLQGHPCTKEQSHAGSALKHRESKKHARKGNKEDKKAMRTHSGPVSKGPRLPDVTEQDLYSAFCQEHLREQPAPMNAMMNTYGYSCPLPIERLSGLRVVRPGWFLGTFKSGRFEPSHAMALGLKAVHMKRVYPLQVDSDTLIPYLRGDTLTIGEKQLVLHSGAAAKGYVLITLMDAPLGFGKYVNGMLKNEYPAAWRWNS